MAVWCWLAGGCGEGAGEAGPVGGGYPQDRADAALGGLRDVADERGWFIDRRGEIQLPPTQDLIEPDVMILRDADSLPDFEHERPLDHVLLVAEVISPSSIREDREVKPRACAMAGIPLYVLVDRFTSPMTVSLFSKPSTTGYATVSTVTAGGKLDIPAPFDITLDTATLPQPRLGEGLVEVAEAAD